MIPGTNINHSNRLTTQFRAADGILKKPSIKHIQSLAWKNGASTQDVKIIDKQDCFLKKEAECTRTALQLLIAWEENDEHVY